MSSSNLESNLENSSPLHSHGNNDCDNTSTNGGNSKTEREDENRSEQKSRNQKYLNKMLHLLKEFLIMVLVAITYAAITNDPPKIGKSPAAYRFFPDDPHITDWYRGEISDTINQARSVDIAFVMFYAPWDAECQHARREFQKVARYMKHEITFSAVNCWQPGSECKTQYGKVHKWPILIAYPTHGRGVQYFGPLIAVYMMQFLKKVMFPFTRKKTSINLLAQYDAVVVGKVYAAPYSKQYGVFYQTALRLLERVSLHEIGVSIETRPLYDVNGMVHKPELWLYMWNETLIYPSYSEWEIEPLLNWIYKHVHHITTWISPNGAKSLSLANHLQPGPALIFFTPKNPLAIHNDFHSMLREIGHEYNDCTGNKWITLIQLAIRLERREKYLEHLRLTEKCSVNLSNGRQVSSHNLWSNTSYCLEKKVKTDGAFPLNDRMIHYYGGISRLCLELLKNLDSKEPNTHKKCSDVRDSYKTSKLTEISDDKSSHNLKNIMDRNRCRNFLISQKYQPMIFSSELYHSDSYNISGLKCKTNKTLSLISMDSLFYHHFAEKLGVDLARIPNRTAVVILDDERESHYIMDGEVNESNLRRFIHKYTTGSLPRALTSLSSLVSKNTHSYPKDRQCSFAGAKFCVQELSSGNFLETISQANKAVIIFYYSKQCSFCNGISYCFLTVAKHFSNMEDFIFARIDGDLNLLPWEYTMDIYPTILFVPPDQVSESRVFPMDMRITIPNLVRFILANLQPALKLEAMWNLCEKSKFFSNDAECISTLRLQILSVIDKILQEWRLCYTKEEKSILFIKLQHLHSLHFLFIEYTYNNTLAEYHFTKLKTIDMKPAETPVRK